MASEKTCDSCGKAKASLILARDLAGIQQQYAFCPDCASARGIRVAESVLPCLPADLLDPLVSSPDSALMNEVACAACGTLFKDIRGTGLAGCVHCFDQFHAEIGRLLPRIARRTSHTGSIPRQLHELRRLFADKAALTARLETALAAEDFEAAADLRDVLDDLGSGADAP